MTHDHHDIKCHSKDIILFMLPTTKRKLVFYYALFIVVIQYHNRKYVFHIVPHSTDVGVKV